MIERAGAPDEQLGQIMVNAPVALPVGVGQGAVGNFAANAQVIELILARAQTGFHIAEAFPKGELAKSHAEKLIPAGEGFYFIVSVIAAHAAAKLLRVDQVGELGENKFSGIHPGSLAKNLLGENRIKTSSRSHPRSINHQSPINTCHSPLRLFQYPDSSALTSRFISRLAAPIL